MHNGPYKGALLADDMGLGKTVQVCAYLQCIADRHLLDSCLIVVPNSVVPVWRNAFREWTSISYFLFVSRVACRIVSLIKCKGEEGYSRSSS